MDDLFGDIYEAALLPQHWPRALGRIAEASPSSDDLPQNVMSVAMGAAPGQVWSVPLSE